MIRIGIVFLMVELFHAQIVSLVMAYMPDDTGIYLVTTIGYFLPLLRFIGYSLVALGYAESKRLVSYIVLGLFATMLCLFYGIKHNNITEMLLFIGTGLLWWSLYGVGRFYNITTKSITYALLSLMFLIILTHIPSRMSFLPLTRLTSVLLYFYAAYGLFKAVDESEQKPFLGGLKLVAVVLAMSPVVFHLQKLSLNVIPMWAYSSTVVGCVSVGFIGWIKLYADYNRKQLAGC